jgi:DNA-directed RNA polymerase specialized sigma24 family protein
MNFGRAVTSELARRRFAKMVLPHLDDAYGLAHWLTGNRADAEDVVQDASIRALPERFRTRVPGAFSSCTRQAADRVTRQMFQVANAARAREGHKPRFHLNFSRGPQGLMG